MARSKRGISSQPASLMVFFADWSGCLLVFGAAFCLGGANLIENGGPSAAGLLAGVMLILAAALHLWRRHRSAIRQSQANQFEGPLLLMVIAWSMFRLGATPLPQLVFLPAATLAWITIRFPARVALICGATGAAIESGLALGGNQPAGTAVANILICAAAAAALYFFPGSAIYRKERHQALADSHQDLSSREQARELGLDTGDVSAAGIFQDISSIDHGATFSRRTIVNINRSFELQLEIIRQALDLTTVAVLWPNPANDELRLRYLASSRQDIDPGPYPSGTGITGALTGNRQMAELVGVRPSHPALPYYRNQEGTGSVLALRIPSASDAPGEIEAQRWGILCADREAPTPWTEQEKQVLRLAADKLALEISGSRLLLNLDRERSTIHRLYLGLRELNSGLDLESIFTASLNAARAQVPADLLALCLREEDRYRLVLVEGPGSEKLLNQYFPVEDGLVGQAMKTGRTLPAGGRYLGSAPIFSSARTFSDYQSLLIVPLPDEDNDTLGCLVVAATSPGVFTRSRREILKLIAAQVAIKIKLGQAHEKLGMMATTDGLTGLANHRAFQNNYEIMLDRARRTKTPLCLLMGDLDRFKKINDNFGHPFGDHVLKKVAAVLAETVRTVDVAARYGGEEFAILLENCDAAGGHMLAERIRKKIQHLGLICGEQPLTVTISTGIAVFPEDGTVKAELINRADQALYLAKKEGRNQTMVWSDSMG